jgi:hypothetical protein
VRSLVHGFLESVHAEHLEDRSGDTFRGTPWESTHTLGKYAHVWVFRDG